MSYDVTLELHASGRFELRYRDVTPDGGRVVHMEGAWEQRRDEQGGNAIYAAAETGSESTWIGDRHRQQHQSRRPDGPSFASEPERTGVSTAERRWPVLVQDGTPRILLGPHLDTRVGRAAVVDGETTWPRCDPGRFNR